MKNIIIIGARGYESNYGGWETFVTNLIKNYHDKNVKFHVAELCTFKKDDNSTINDLIIGYIKCVLIKS